MNTKIRWINEAKGDETSEGFWRSLEGRFTINNLYNHSTRPFAYDLIETGRGKVAHGYTVKSVKEQAQKIIDMEIAKLFAPTAADIANAQPNQ